jgi:hypothetical protein
MVKTTEATKSFGGRQYERPKSLVLIEGLVTHLFNRKTRSPSSWTYGDEKK